MGQVLYLANAVDGSFQPLPCCAETGLVLVLTLFMAAASGLGGVPYFFVRSFSKEYSALASAVACGVMLAASFDLVHEGQPYGANMVILGVLFGETLEGCRNTHARCNPLCDACR